MKITRPNDPAPLEVLEVVQPLEAPEPAPEPIETPAQIERHAADDAAIAGTRALVAELQARLATVTAQANEHRQCANTPFAGDPGALAAHLATTEQHRADADRLAVEAESLRRQCAVAAALLGKLEADQADAESARTQARGRALLADALERYTEVIVDLGAVIVDMGAAAMLANMQSSFIAATRSLCVPDLVALGYYAPALAGFIKRREGQTVNQSDPAYQQRANQLLRAE